jgi:hypothetical protein
MRSSNVVSAVSWRSSVLRGDRVLTYWWSSFYWLPVAILLRVTMFVIHLFNVVVFWINLKFPAIGERNCG